MFRFDLPAAASPAKSRRSAAPSPDKPPRPPSRHITTPPTPPLAAAAHAAMADKSRSAHATITVTAEDTYRLHSIALASGFASMDAQSLVEPFVAAAQRGDQGATGSHVTGQAFKRINQQLVPNPPVDPAMREETNKMLWALFYTLAGDDGEKAALPELIAALMLLTGGAKSDKLALAFELFDGDGDGMLTPNELRRMLMSFLTAVHALTEDGGARSAMAVARTSDAAAHSLTVTIVDCVAESQDASELSECRISFEDLGSWYNDMGFQLAPWLELLDLRKW